MKSLIISLIFLLAARLGWGSDTLTIRQNSSEILTSRYFTQLEDAHGKMALAQVLTGGNFHQPHTSRPYVSYADAAIWIRLVLRNKTSEPYVPIAISNGVIDDFDMYMPAAGKPPVHLGSTDALDKKSTAKQISRLINCPILPDSTALIYLRIISSDANAVPIKIESADYYLHSNIFENLTIGFFMGIIIIMTLYNLLLYVLVKDVSYLYYVFYIVFLGLTQWENRGLGSTILVINKMALNNYLIPLTRVCFWFSILLFVHEFLQLKQNLPKRQHNFYYLLWAMALLPLMAILAGRVTLAYSLVTVTSFISSISLLFIGIRLYSKGFKPAKFFMLGWSLFLMTVVASIARNKGLLPYNNFTANIILYSSAFELVMFSVALADRINFYRRQNAETQSLALAAARENERLITGQNLVLEKKVSERTLELLESNTSLSATIDHLKSAQMQLIDTEKMASLGQLTAGIAHEINNPINFVSANVKPLRMDLDEIFTLINFYQQLTANPADEELQQQTAAYAKKIDIDFIKGEIATLLDGIEDGAGRTTEIVQSLRTFSRTDELTLKEIDINRAILATLVLLRSTMPQNIEVKTVLGELPVINGYPGKINQALVNLINNSIQAIKAKTEHSDELITVITKETPESIVIEISDTGVGMTDETKQHIFDPFFTTKDIGEGTGLGLSIVFGIVEQHQGIIEVKSKPGEGATFTVTLPKGLK